MQALPDYLKPLEHLTQPFPESAVKEAIARRDESIPYLLEALEWTAGNVEEALEMEDYFLPIYALFLLAQFRERGAYEPAIQLARNPASDELLDDVLTEGLPAVLASLSGGDAGPVGELIDDDGADPFARGAGLFALGAMHRNGLLSREALSSNLVRFYEGGLSREPSHVWDALVAVSTDLGMPEHLEHIRLAYREGLADPGFEPLGSVEGRIRHGELSQAEHSVYRLVDDAIAEMSYWHCFGQG